MIFGSQAPCRIRAHGTDSSIFGLLRPNQAAPEASSFFLNTLKGDPPRIRRCGQAVSPYGKFGIFALSN
jgi:hypothetical protein